MSTEGNAGSTFNENEPIRNEKIFFNLAIGIAAIITVCLCILCFVLPNNIIRWVTVIIIFDAACFVLLNINKKGKTLIASKLFVVFIFSLIIGLAWTAGGIKAHSIQFLPLVVLTAGLLLGWRAGFIVSIFGILFSLVLVIAEFKGILPSNLVIANPISLWVVAALNISALALLQYLLISRLNKSLAYAKNELSLRINAEKTLQLNEAHYRTIFENANDAIFLMKEDIFINCNPKTLELFGCLREQIINHTPYAFSPLYQPDGNLSGVKALNYIKLALSGIPQRFEWLHCRFDNSNFEAEVSLNKLEINNEILLQAIVRDISNRKQSEILLKQKSDELEAQNEEYLQINEELNQINEELVEAKEKAEESEAKLKAMFESSRDAIGVAKKGIHIYANPSYLKLFGFDTNEDIFGTYIFDSIAPSHRQMMLDYVQRRSAGESVPKFYESRGINTDGTEFDAEFSVSTYELNGEIYTLASIRDITDRKIAEKNLKISEEKFFKIFHSSPDAILLTELQSGKIIEINRSFENFSGYNRNEAIGHTALELNMFKPEDRQKFVSLLQQYGSFQDVEFNNKNKAGEELIILASAELIEIGNKLHAITILHDITERKLAEEELKISEERYSRIVNTASEGIVIVDKTINIVFVNLQFSKMLGFEEKELIGKPFTNFIKKEDIPVLHSMIETRRQGLPDKAERSLLRKDGTEIWVLVSATPIMDEIEGFQGSFSMLTDITERKNAEIALRKSEERFRLILENMPILLNAFDNEENIISWNKACEVATGYKEEEAKSNPKIMELLYPDPDYRTLVWNASSDQLKQNNAFDLVAKDGNIHTIEWFDTYHILKIPGWDSWGMGLDITERNQAQTALKKSEDRFRNMADLLPQAIFETDTNGRLTYVNKTAYELFGYTQEDFDKGLLAFDMVIPEERELVYSKMQVLINERNISKTEYTALKKDGFTFPVLIHTNTISLNNEFSGLRGIILDMTEIKLAEKKIKLSEERLRKLIDSVTDYIFTVKIENNIVKETIHSEGCFAVTGYHANEFYNDNYLWFKIVVQDDMGIVKQQAIDLVQNKIEKTIEHRIIHKNGTIHWVSNTPVLRYNQVGELLGYDGLIADITARKIAEAALFESETRYRLIATLSGHLVYECNLNDNSIVWGGAIQEVTGYTPFEYEKVNKNEWADMVHPEDKERLLALYHEFVNKEKNFKVEYRYKTKDEGYIWIEEESFIFSETANKVLKVVGVMKDITNKKSIERQILNSVIETEERERLNFSQELHDGIGPLLSATKMYIQWLGLPNAKLDQSDILRDVEKLLDESTKTVREISFKLSPHILQNYGLVEALNAYIEKVQESSQIKIDMNLKNLCRFNEKAEIIVYRVICECINNTIKHAKASSIIINLICQNNLLFVEYIDNGQGFDLVNVITNHKGIGLLNMQSRLKSINGLMDIVSSPNNGTSIKFQINIHDN